VQRAAAWGLLTLLVVVFPANVNVALFNLHIAGYPDSPVYQWGRLLLQIGLIWLVWLTTRPEHGDAPEASRSAPPSRQHPLLRPRRGSTARYSSFHGR
jgi:uncharacterized membrane protein